MFETEGHVDHLNLYWVRGARIGFEDRSAAIQCIEPRIIVVERLHPIALSQDRCNARVTSHASMLERETGLPNSVQGDQELALICRTWPSLPDTVRVSIAGSVRAFAAGRNKTPLTGSEAAPMPGRILPCKPKTLLLLLPPQRGPVLPNHR
jgi:hypothetical protein